MRGMKESENGGDKLYTVDPSPVGLRTSWLLSWPENCPVCGTKITKVRFDLGQAYQVGGICLNCEHLGPTDKILERNL